VSRVTRFEDWLRARGTADVFDRRITDRLLAIAGERPVNNEHVELALEQADASTAISIAQLGKLLIRCELTSG
jgi:hypothetical protein